MSPVQPAGFCALVAVILPFAAFSCRQPVPAAEKAASAPSPAAAFFDPAMLSGKDAMDEVRRFVEKGPRDAGTPGAREASAYLAERLRLAGLNPEVDEFTEETPDGRKTFRNVTALIRGTGGDLVVIGSHYDTKSGMAGGFQGANDSGSSTGLLLALASVFGKGPRPRAGILLAFFDGEECVRSYGPDDGLHGSRRLARKLVEEGAAGKVVAVIVLDMIGDKDLDVSMPQNSTASLCSLVFEAAHEENARRYFSLGNREVLDDHVPFLKAGMPAVDLIDFSYGSGPGLNDYWHTKEDTMDKLSDSSLEIVGRVVIRAVNRISAKAKAP